MTVTAETVEPKLTPEAIFRDYAPRIYSVARRMLGNDADAEDVTQDVLLQVVRKLDTFRGDAQISTWLHRVTVNAALAHREKRATRDRRETHPNTEDAEGVPTNREPVKGWGPRPEDNLLATERHDLIEKAMVSLPEVFRDVFVLSDVEGLSNSDIAEILHLTVPAVKSRLHRARLQMRDLLAPHFEGGQP